MALKIVELSKVEVHAALDFRRRMLIVHNFIPFPNPPLPVHRLIAVNTAMASAYTGQLLASVWPNMANVECGWEVETDNPVLKGHLRFDFNEHYEILLQVLLAIRESIDVFTTAADQGGNGLRSKELVEKYGMAIGYAEAAILHIEEFLVKMKKKMQHACT